MKDNQEFCEASTIGVPSIFPDFGSMGDFFQKIIF